MRDPHDDTRPVTERRQREPEETDPGPALRRALARRRRGSRILLWFVIFLGTLAVVQAVIFIPILMELADDGKPADPEKVNLSEREIRVLSADGDVSLLLKSPLDLREADDEQAKRLDGALFPDGARHRYFLLHAVNATDAKRSVAVGPIVVTDDDGQRHSPIDLAAAIARAEKLPASLRFYLDVRVPPNGRVDLPPKSTRDFLVAFPEALTPERMASATVGEITLSRQEFVKDELDDFLEDPAHGRD